jgi:hypothetical protein
MNTVMKKNLSILVNLFIIIILIALRTIAGGFILLTISVVLIPIIIFHIISTTLALKNYLALKTSDKKILLLSIFSFIIFILFQPELDDRWGYMVIEIYFRKIFHTSYSDLSDIATIITIISGILLIICDIYVVLKIRSFKRQKI